MVRYRWAVLGAALVALLGPGPGNEARAGSLTNGNLTVDINNTSGAINSLIFNGQEFYRLGAFVSDFGFQVGTNTATFRINDANGFAGTPVVVAPGAGVVVVTGTYTGGGAASVAFTQTYSIVDGLDVLRISTTFTNTGPAPTTLRYFGSYDPDQGKPTTFTTFNDVFNLATDAGSARVAQAIAGTGAPPLTVVAGSVDGSSVTGFVTDGDLGIFSGTQLNNFFNAQLDPNGAEADIGFAVAREFLLGVGASATFTYDQAVGPDAASAQAAFIAAQGEGIIPEPATITLLSIGTLSLAGYSWRRRKPAAQ